MLTRPVPGWLPYSGPCAGCGARLHYFAWPTAAGAICGRCHNQARAADPSWAGVSAPPAPVPGPTTTPKGTP